MAIKKSKPKNSNGDGSIAYEKERNKWRACIYDPEGNRLRPRFDTKEQAEEFYKEHQDKVFFPSMIQQMISGPVVVQVLEGDDAIKHYREIMGATNPAVAEEGTIRKTYALSIDKNTVHGSDSPESAAREIEFFFNHTEIVG